MSDPVERPVPALRHGLGFATDLGLLVVLLMLASVSSGQFQVPEVAVIGFALASWIPLLFRRRWPLQVMVVVLGVEALHIACLAPAPGAGDLMGYYQPVPTATAVAVGWYASRPRAHGVVAGVLSAAGLLVTAGLTQSRAMVATDLNMAALVLLATAIGAGLRSRRENREQAATEQRALIRDEVRTERLRIARELHDGLAHHLTLVNAQAGVAEYLLAEDPARAAQALRGIAEHTRLALDEVRSTVGLLRLADEDDPATRVDPAATQLPGLADVDDLVAAARASGLAVSCDFTGTPRSLRPDIDLTVYRIVQESLTNAAKHAPGSDVQLSVVGSGNELTVTVENGPARRPATPRLRGGGHGLLGMNERATACGGDLQSFRTTTGGFLVRAHLPISTPTPTESQ